MSHAHAQFINAIKAESLIHEVLANIARVKVYKTPYTEMYEGEQLDVDRFKPINLELVEYVLKYKSLQITFVVCEDMTSKHYLLDSDKDDVDSYIRSLHEILLNKAEVTNLIEESLIDEVIEAVLKPAPEPVKVYDEYQLTLTSKTSNQTLQHTFKVPANNVGDISSIFSKLKEML